MAEKQESLRVTLLSGRANRPLAENVAADLGIRPGRCTIEDFPDGELQIEVHEDLRGQDVYIVQPTSPPVSNHLLELLLLGDACQRAGALRITAVVPYFGYARQDRRVHGTEPVGARLVADLLCTRFERVITVDLHNPSTEGFFTSSVEHLSAVPLLAESLRPFVSGNPVIVAPDLGAVKLAQHYADLLDLPVAYVHKVRLSGKEVSVRRVVGDVRDHSLIVIDDMISTGGTMATAIEALLERGSRKEITIAATHALFVGNAVQRFESLPVQRVIATDSVYHPPSLRVRTETVSLKNLLSETIRRLHKDHQ